MFPRERERPPDACAYPRFWKVDQPGGPVSSFARPSRKGVGGSGGFHPPPPPDMEVGRARRPQTLLDYFTLGEPEALSVAPPGRAFAEVRGDQHPARGRGNKSRKGLEVPIPTDLPESLADLGFIPHQEPRSFYAGHLPPMDSGGHEARPPKSAWTRSGPATGGAAINHMNCRLAELP